MHTEDIKTVPELLRWAGREQTESIVAAIDNLTDAVYELIKIEKMKIGLITDDHQIMKLPSND